ncbi:MAG: hypothetical protein HY862_18500 [Chloroflexi bacterium]|nr:hypothetical protein [Chloroflexota bacterium]
MGGTDLAPERQIAGVLLIAPMFIFAVGGILFTGRAIWKWPIGQTPVYLRWERSFVVTALIVNVLGLVILEGLLSAAGDTIIARLALVSYLMSAVVVLVAEMSYLHNRDWAYPQIVLHVVIAFLSQAAFGAALLQTGLVASWVGWVTIVWNVAWLVVLAIASPSNMYFPALHHVAPLFIGISLLIRA